MAGILFESSSLWDAAWWWWHLLRLAAYAILIFFFYRTFLKILYKIQNSYKNAELSAKKFKKEVKEKERMQKQLNEYIENVQKAQLEAILAQKDTDRLNKQMQDYTDKLELARIEAMEAKEGKKNVRLYFEVEDTGIGITEDKIDYIFNKFSQAEESTTRQFGGTGLGLAICRSLTNMMGGSISAKSTINKGSCFYFDILLPIGQKEKRKCNIPNINLKNFRAIVADDYKTNCEILYQYLHSWGMECDVFLSAEEAYKAANDAFDKGSPYDIALVDYRLGGMTGLEFTRKIRENKNLKDKLLVMITSVGHIASAEELKQQGLTGFLTKPFYPEQLKALLKLIIYAKEHNEKLDKLVTRHMVTRLMRDEAEKATSEIIQFSDKRILVVEDMKVNLMLLTKLLEKHNIRVDSAANGLEAVDMLKQFDYDLVFMDCQMPEMDGFEATREIRKLEKATKKKHTNIVALTADAMTGDREKCLNAGMDDYLNKPVRAQEISDMLEKWIK